MAYAAPDDVAARLGRELDESESMIVSVRLDDAERLIRAQINDLDGMVLDAEINQEDLKYVEAEAVLRLVRNPDGHSIETDGNYSYRIDSRVASGKLEILDDEWDLLGVTRGAFIIAPVTRRRVRRYFPANWYEPVEQGETGDSTSGRFPIHPAVWW